MTRERTTSSGATVRRARPALAFFALLVCRAAAAGAASGPGDAAGVEFFEGKIRPVLAERCYKCHSAGAAAPKGGLRVDSRDGLLKGGEGGPALVPGEPGKSRLVTAITYDNADLQMPPKGRLSPEQVADVTEWVRRGAPWPAEPAPVAVAPVAGAPPAFDLWARRAAHWAWQPVRAPAVPGVRDAAWPRGAVDRFVLSRLEGQGLRPAPDADRRAWIRRASFVVVGLPPSPEEVEAFARDPAPDAMAKVVDRLLASPQFGERWARHWMDLVRYSDTLGNETDLPIHNAWRYRDYLIRAFNADVPYDRLVTEHVAGDLLAAPRRRPDTGENEAVLGTGFFWLGEGKRSPVDLRQAQAECFDNRLDVLCKTFLGLTVACARCHDHKFDAIPTADYYALYGYLKSSRYTQAMVNADEVNAKAAELTALRAKIREASGAALAGRAGNLSRYLLAAAAAKGAPADGLDAGLLKRWAAALKEPADAAHPLFAWQRMADPAVGAKPQLLAARWREVEGQVTARGAELTSAAAAREGDVTLAQFGRSGFGDWLVQDQSFGPAPLRPGDFLMGRDASRPVLTFFRGGPWAHSGFLSRRLEGTLRSPSFTIDRHFLHVLAAGRASRINVVIEHFVMIQDPLYGRLRHVLNGDGGTWHTFDLSMWKGRRAYLEVADTTTQDLHDTGPAAGCGPDGYAAVGQALLSDQGPPPAPAAVAGLAIVDGAAPASLEALAARYQRVATDSLASFANGRLVDAPDAEARAALLAWLVERGLLDAPESAAEAAAGRGLATLFEQFRAAEASVPEPRRAPAMTEGTAEDEHVFVRGSPKDAGPAAPRRMLQAIAGAADAQPAAPANGSGRLELARQFADPSNPLTARVMVNRVWHHVFARGIVPSVDNFGALGDRPSHPELLEHLADRFVKEGWSVKKLVRELVLSRTFGMATQPLDAAAESADPDNRLLHRMPVRRLDAESIRDQILAVSGRLDRRPYSGPGVEVYLTPFMDNGYAEMYGRPKAGGPPDGDGRRSIYQVVRRNFLPPLMTAFDAPAPLNTAGRRGTSNVPAQALILMNDPFVAGQAKLWATRVLARPGLDDRGRVGRMYAEAFARPPSDAEVATALGFLDRQARALGVPMERRADDGRPWADLAHVLMNVKEFTFLN